MSTFLRYLYTCRVQQSLYGNKSSDYCNWLALYSDFPLEIILCKHFSPIYLKLGLNSDYTQLYRKYLPSSRFP